MPKWIHDRAEHIMRKNPQMPKSEAWAIATNQSKTKEASVFWGAFFDEMAKEAVMKPPIAMKPIHVPHLPKPPSGGTARQMGGEFKGLASTMHTPKPTTGTVTPGAASSAVAAGRPAGQTLGTSTTPSPPPVTS